MIFSLQFPFVEFISNYKSLDPEPKCDKKSDKCERYKMEFCWNTGTVDK